jgi:hypothetical protein
MAKRVLYYTEGGRDVGATASHRYIVVLIQILSTSYDMPFIVHKSNRSKVTNRFPSLDGLCWEEQKYVLV